jgi:catechol-2,3-dioxygenase
MANSTVTGVRSIELGVRDLHQSAEFYTKVWALEEVSAAGDTMHFRATGGEHHVLTIRERPQASLLGVHFAAADRVPSISSAPRRRAMALPLRTIRHRSRPAPAAVTASGSRRPTGCR